VITIPFNAQKFDKCG